MSKEITLKDIEDQLGEHSCETGDIAEAVRGIAEAMFIAHEHQGDRHLLMGRLSSALTIIGNEAGKLSERQFNYSTEIGRQLEETEGGQA